MKKIFRKPLFIETIAFFGSNALFQATRFATYMYAAKILGPKKYGLWTGFALLLMYAPYIQMGVFNALNREIPFYEGSGETDKIEEIRNVGYAVALVTGILLFVIIFATSFLSNFDSDTAIGLRLVSFLVIVQHYYLFQQMILRSHGMFHLMSIQQMLFSILSIIIVLPLVKVFTFTGFIIGQVIVIILCLIFISYKINLNLNPVFNYIVFIKLSKIGFPIMMVGITFGLLQTTDRFIILHYLGKEQLGYYSLSIMAYSMFIIFPLTLSQIFYPVMARKYGQTRKVSELLPLVYIQSFAVFVVMLPVSVIVILIAPTLITYFMPEYSFGLEALKNSMIGLCFLSLVGALANLLNTIGCQRIYLIIVLIAISISVSINVCLAKFGYGIKEIALATSASNIIYFILVCSAVFIIIRRKLR